MYIIEIKTFERIKYGRPNYKEHIEYINKNQGIVPIINRATRFTKEEALEFCKNYDKSELYNTRRFCDNAYKIIGILKQREKFTKISQATLMLLSQNQNLLNLIMTDG